MLIQRGEGRDSTDVGGLTFYQQSLHVINNACLPIIFVFEGKDRDYVFIKKDSVLIKKKFDTSNYNVPNKVLLFRKVVI